MVITKAKNVFKSVFHKQNKDYLSAEVAGSIASLVTATAANIAFNELGFPKELNSVCTYATQLFFSVGTYTLTYRYVHKKEEDPKGKETRKHVSHLVKLGGKIGIASGIAKFAVHYLLLHTKLPPNITAPISYALIGLGFSYIRHKENYDKGILVINNNNAEKDKEQKQEKPASIDELVC